MQRSACPDGACSSDGVLPPVGEWEVMQEDEGTLRCNQITPGKHSAQVNGTLTDTQ